ncbi:MAG: ECF transporter S component [Solobacterium sp.]|nr:ECF transporter S component [Solobacterium sp.]
MSRSKKRIQQLTLAAFFVAIEVIMAVTPIGFIPVGAINITTMHLPVILAGIVLGPIYGAMMGFVFGMTSMLRATFIPGITSFCFSPFITVGGISGNFWSAFIALVPRMTLGCLSFYIYRAVRKLKKSRITAAAVSAGLNTLIHTLFVMGSIWLFFGEAYASAAGIGVGAVIVTVLTSNGILEILLASIVIPALVKALKPAMERMGFYDK